MSVESEAIPAGAVEEFRSRLRGALLAPGDGGYEDARAIWNGMIDRRPAWIARCADAGDVVLSVNFARDQGLVVSVRGGGHSMPGVSVCEGGLMIDLSPMKGVRIDPEARVAWVEPGVTLGEFDRAAQEFGLATPAGAIAHTGVAGLTLGGGVGWLMRKYGLTCDSLMAADVVAADGRVVRASEDENDDLLWGLRGGGGNFGVVTSFEFRLHPVGPVVLAGTILHPVERAEEVVRFYRDFLVSSPDELTSIAPFFHCPPEAPFPTSLHDRPVVGLVPCWCGSLSEGEEVLRPLREFGPPAGDFVEPTSFVELQSMQDETFAWGQRYYNKNVFLDDLTDDVIATVVEHYGRVPSPRSIAVIMQCGGQVNRVRVDATAFPHRTGDYAIDITSIWTDPEADAENVAWVRNLHTALQRYEIGTYGNTMSEGAMESVYGENYGRLVRLKTKYDPENFFHLNHNIPPSG